MLAVLFVERIFLAMPLSNRPILLVAVMLVLIGLQFICSGLIAEVLVRTYHESQGKKIYAIRRVVRHETTDGVDRTEKKLRAL